MQRPRLALVLSLAGVLCATLAFACSVPVFRYALERWRHDRDEEQFVLTVRGPLSEAHRATLRDLAPEQTRANWRIETKESDDQEPRLTVRAPVDADDAEKPSLYEGPLDKAALLRLVDSPLRRTIAAKLLAGDSVVWVLLETGEKDRDDAVAARVRQELDRLETLLKLPEQEDDPESVLRSKVPLKIAFPLVRLSRQDKTETLFLHQLLTLDEDRREATGPMLFPIFGRGRLLTGLIEKEITPRILEEAARFLCGPCSCQVKKLNPGVDLLWAADWDSILENVAEVDQEKPLPPPSPLTLTKKPAQTPPAVTPQHGDWGRFGLLAGIGGAAALVLITGWFALRLGRAT